MGYYSRIIDLQNLQRAWKKVYANRPAAGSDNISAEQFEQKEKEYLYQLHVELKTGQYMPQVVKQIEFCKNGKNRTIALFCMRDKVVQQSICTVISGAIEQKISSRAFAYRNGKSAMAGVNEIEEVMQKQGFQWFLKMDIEKYFDTVDIERCLGDVRSITKEEEVIRLIGVCMRAPYYASDGTITSKIKGLYQGSAISPMLSNLYLMNFDDFMEKNTEHYIRYSDDMLVLGRDFSQLERLREVAKCQLEALGLKLKDNKTTIVSVQEGVEFLGMRLTDKGKEIPQKAEARLKEKLEDVWFSDEWSMEEKLKKGSEILGGWEQYYNMDREIGDIIEYAIVLAHAIQQKDTFLVQTLKKQRKRYENIYRENVLYFTDVWKKLGELDLVLHEYEQFFQLEKMDKDKRWREEEDKQRGIVIFEQLIAREDTENLTELMQLYVDMHMYNKAQCISERMQRMDYGTINVPADVTDIEDGQKSDIEKISLNATEKQLYIQRFVGREDTYGVATVKLNGKYSFEQVKHPFSEEVLEQHLLGNQTVAGYIQRNNDTVHAVVFDVDISKKVILQYSDNEKVIERYMKNAQDVTRKLIGMLKRLGICAYVEYSGYRGYHVWIFFEEWIPVKYCNLFQDCVLKQDANLLCEGITLECFPNKKKRKENQPGQMIKLPWGVHYCNGQRTYFVDDNFRPMERQKDLLGKVEEYNVETIKRIIVAHTGENLVTKKNRNLEGIEEFGELADEVRIVLENCGLQRYLCLKAKRTGYLSHYERLSILYVFGHLGDAGKDFLHEIMSCTLNYQYAVTERFIHKCPSKPISCIKLREQYKQVTAEVGCDCNFRRTKNCYPSPVLHVVTDGGDQNVNVTMPITKKMSKESERVIYEEINIPTKVGELVKKLMELKRQNRGVEKAIKKQEEELGKIFDQTNTECMELEMGRLKRVKTSQGVEWIIEL